MTEWTKEEDEAFNEVEKHSNLGKQILREMGQPYHYEPKRAWVGLTDKEIDQGLLRSDYAFKTAEAWRAGVVFAMTKLKEKNSA